MSEKIPVLKVWQTDNGLEIQMLKTSGNKYLMLGLLEEIRYSIVSGNADEKDDLDSPNYNPMTSEKYDA